MNYTMALKDGKPVAGLYTLTGEQQAMGIPPHWASYLAVADADATLDAVTAAGGSPLGPARDAPGGRVGMFVDPTGAAAGIWQSKTFPGAALANEHGTLIWNELQTNDTAAAERFYVEVFGWEAETAEMPNGPYTSFKDGEDYRGGMMSTASFDAAVPSNWVAYFAVDDVDAVIAAAIAAGGQVVAPAFDVEGIGRMAVLQSADGAYFSLFAPRM
jgi:predicted enzyme related to lactoylglutathione lyase